MSKIYAVTANGEYVEFPDHAPQVDVDVREELRTGKEPFTRIMAAVDALPPGHILHIRATFAPVPLISLLSERGFVYHMDSAAEDDWSVWFWQH